MQLDYELHDAGWAEVRITEDNQTVRVTVSYLHDSLRELVSAVLQLHAGGAIIESCG